MIQKINKVIKALEKNNMQGIYVERIEEISPLVEKMLFNGAMIATGGSVSLQESGVCKLISNGNYNFLDRNQKDITQQQRQQILRNVIGCDFFLCSANALTENGELINVDGFANRISAIAFGPKKVVMIVGSNKIVKDLKEGFLRIKKIAAPKNCVRLGIDTPCAKLGHCVSLLKGENPDITDGCEHERRICLEYLITAKQREVGRITVIICKEFLGY